MSVAPGLQHLRIDSTSVVANPHAQITDSIFKFELDALGLGVTECVNQSFSPYSVKLVPNRWPQRLLATKDVDTKFDVGLNIEFVLNARQGLNQIRCTGRAEVLYSIAALLNPLVHDLENSI